jgi:uncharacterized protein GlcG (DUF336 family)
MAAIAAIIAKATEMEHCIAVAVTDQAGELIASARMDDAAARWVRHARRKAYTAAIMGRSTKQLGEELRRRGLSVAEYGDHNITTLPGGAPILHRPTQARAAVGVAGNGGAEFDDTLAALGVRLLDDS